MSLLGQTREITVTRSGASLLFVGVLVYPFLHEVGFITTATCIKNDITLSTSDTYVVKISYPLGSIPPGTTSTDNMVTAAQAAILAQYGATELS